MKISEYKNKIINGNAKEILQKFPDESIDCVITSPPYWALRDYGVATETIWDSKEKCIHEWDNLERSHPSRGKRDGSGVYLDPKYERKGANKSTVNSSFCIKCNAWKGQLGLEPTIELYIKHLSEIFDEVKRVLKKEGTCWVNISDTYYSVSGGKFENDNLGSKDRNRTKGLSQANQLKHGKELAQKNLCNIPARFSIEMQNRGWILRNEIIWHKTNCMPSSVRDRFTVDFEKVYFFTKNKKYFFERQYEDFLSNQYDRARMAKARTEYGGKWAQESGGAIKTQRAFVAGNKQGRNRRCVWTINTHPFKGAHFATFPPRLIETPIKAGCPEFICKKCGKAREKIWKYLEKPTRTGKGNKQLQKDKENGLLATQGGTSSSRPDCTVNPASKEFIGYTDCSCGIGFRPGIVLDPFIGSGTTAVVAQNLGLDFVGIELNSKYVVLAEKRVVGETQRIRNKCLAL